MLQQDIQRGRQMVDSLFQGAGGADGTHNAIMTSEDYLSTAQRTLNNMEEGYYISPSFLDKVHFPGSAPLLPCTVPPLRPACAGCDCTCIAIRSW